MRSKRKFVIALAAAVLVLAYGGVRIFHEIPALQNEKYSKVVGSYSGKLAFDFGGGEAYAVGANSVGDPVFKDPEKAFRQVTQDYRKGFQEIQKCHLLLPIYALNWRDYGTYGWQTSVDNPELESECVHISQFFDIYENSFG